MPWSEVAPSAGAPASPPLCLRHRFPVLVTISHCAAYLETQVLQKGGIHTLHMGSGPCDCH